MDSTTPQQTQPSSSKPGRKPKKSAEPLEPGQKPRKVNSEIRKQQNRIASRNYREKRKRKLQYLQQLLRDQPSDQQASQASDTTEDARTRSLSAEYHAQVQPVDPASFPHNVHFNSLPSTSQNVIDPVLVTTSAYDSHLLATSQPFHGIEPAWNAPIYEHPPQSNISSWNVPPWMPSIDFTPQMQTGSEEYHYSPPQNQQVFDQIPTPPQQSHTPVPNADLFIVGSYTHCRRPTGQAQGISSCMMGHRTFQPPKHSVYI